MATSSETLDFDVAELDIARMADPQAAAAFKILNQEVLPVNYSPEDFLERIDGKTVLGAVALSGAMETQLLGVAVVDLRSSDPFVPFHNSAFFDLLATRNDLREHYGVGSALAEAAIQWAANEGFSSIHGIIENDSPTFHERFGYVSRPANGIHYMVRSL